jgi:hypothetical protein
MELGIGEKMVVSVQYPPLPRSLIEVVPPTDERALEIAAYERGIGTEGGSYVEVRVTTVGPDDYDAIRQAAI